MHWHLREEAPSDQSGIYRVYFEAFGRDAEPRIIDRLRGTADWIPDLSLLAELDGEVIGHVLLSRVGVEDAARPVSLLALGPVAVRPPWQNQGVGADLIRRVLTLATDREFDGAVVLGHANYYPRFGFAPASRFGLKCPFEVPDENYLALELRPDGLAGTGGIVTYPAAWMEE